MQRRPTRAGLAAAAVAGLLLLMIATPATPAPKASFVTPPEGTFARELLDAQPDAAKYPLTWAHPSGDPVTVRQPNGKSIQLKGTDMEVGGVAETVDGYSVMKDRSTGWWVYALKGRNGWEVPTRIRVGVDAPRGIPKHAARTKSVWIDASRKDAREQIFRALQQHQYELQAKAAAAEAAGARVFKIPALMLETHGEFAAESTPEFFEKLLSGTRNESKDINPRGTMTELYLEQSWGALEPRVDVYGPYISPASMASECFYGRKAPGDVSSPGPTGPPIVATVGGMALEAVPQADPEVDFGEYDNDGDNAVDFLLIIHSGPGREATLDDCHVHSHYFSLATAPTTDMKNGEPVIIQSAMTIPEFGLQVGVAAHELMHALGEPDYYDTDGTGEGTGEWDLGGGGPWLGYPPQSNSVHFNPFMKVNMGWVKPQLITSTKTGVRLRSRELYEDLALIPITTVEATEDSLPQWTFSIGGKQMEIIEGYLLEFNNRVASGKPNDSRLPRGGMFNRFTHANGMMAWHFDTRPDGNADETHMRVDLEEADWRDGLQDVQVGLTRGDPLDLFYDDATGLSAATASKTAPEGGDGRAQATPQGSPWTVVSPVLPCGQPEVDCPAHPGAAVPPTWTVDDDPDNVVMRVKLDWTSNSADDWDLYVDRRTGPTTWEQVAYSASGTDPHVGDSVEMNETAVILKPPPGEYRARAVNWLAPTQPQAHISVEFQPTFTKGGSPNTHNWEDKPSGWSFTNIRPAADGVTVDVVKHSAATFDLSADVVTTREGLQAGRAGTLSTRVYNHGGRAVSGVTVSVTDNGRAIGTRTIASIKPYDYVTVTLPYTTSERGMHEFVATVSLEAGEVVTGNNVQRSSLYVGDAGAAVLIVDDDQGYGLEESYAATLAALGVPFAITGDHPTLAEMRRYRAVVWAAGSTQRKNAIDAADRTALARYLEGGGHLLVTGSRTVSGVNAAEPAWLERWLGIKHKDIWQYGTGPVKGNNLSFYADLAPGRSLMDEYEISGGTELYKLDPEVEHEVEGVVGARFAGDKWKTEVHSFSLGQLRDGEARQAVLLATLQHFGIAIGTRTPETAPALLHSPWRVRLNGQATPVIASAVDADGVDSVTLRYRLIGVSSWTSVPMTLSTVASVYEAMIPASAVTPQGFEYAIDAVDASGGKRTDGPHAVSSAIGPKFGAYGSIVSPGNPSVLGAKRTDPLPATGVGTAEAAATLLALASGLAWWTRRRPA